MTRGNDDRCPHCGDEMEGHEDHVALIQPDETDPPAYIDGVHAATGAFIAMWGPEPDWLQAWKLVQVTQHRFGPSQLALVATVWGRILKANRTDWYGVAQLQFDDGDDQPLPVNEIPQEFKWAAHMVGAAMTGEFDRPGPVVRELRGKPWWEVEDSMHALVVVVTMHVAKMSVSADRIALWRKTAMSRWQ